MSHVSQQYSWKKAQHTHWKKIKSYNMGVGFSNYYVCVLVCLFVVCFCWGFLLGLGGGGGGGEGEGSLLLLSVLLPLHCHGCHLSIVHYEACVTFVVSNSATIKTWCVCNIMECCHNILLGTMLSICLCYVFGSAGLLSIRLSVSLSTTQKVMNILPWNFMEGSTM